MRVCVCLLCVSLLLWKGVCAMSWPWRCAHSAFFLLDLTTAIPNPIPVSHPRATWPTGTHEQSHATLSTTYLSETSALHWGNTLASAVAPSALILFLLMLQEAEKSRLVQVHASARVPGPAGTHEPSYATLSTTYLSETSSLHWGNTLASAVAPWSKSMFLLRLQEAEKAG